MGFADLTLGERVEPVLEAHIRGRRRALPRHPPLGGWDASPMIGNAHTAPARTSIAAVGLPRGLRAAGRARPDLRRVAFHPQLADVVDWPAPFPSATIVLDHCGGPLGYGPYAGKRDEVFAAWKRDIAELAALPERRHEARRHDDAARRVDYHARRRPPTSEELADAWRPYIETCIEPFGADRCMFESNFPVDKIGIG